MTSDTSESQPGEMPDEPEVGSYEVEQPEGTLTVNVDTNGHRIEVWQDDEACGTTTTLDEEHNAIILPLNPEIFGEPTGAIELPVDTFEKLQADYEAVGKYREQRRQIKAEREKENPLAFTAVTHRYNAGVDWHTSAKVLKPTKTTLSDEQQTDLEALKESNDTADGYLTVPDTLNLGDDETISFDELLSVEGIEDPDYESIAQREREARHEEAREWLAEQKKQRRRQQYELDVERRWESGSGETHQLLALVDITDPKTGATGRVKLTNTVDAGWWASAEDDTAEDLLESGGKEWLKEFSPIPTGFRMTEHDRGY